MPRPTTAIIDLSSIEHNYNVIKKHCPKSQIYSVVKSNAYGHGVKKVVGALRKSDGFCVATIEESDEFRKFSKKPLLCLQGFYDTEDLKLAHHHKLELVIHNEKQIAHLEKLKLSFPALWLKFDTGMNRLGFMQNEIENMLHRLKPFSKKIVLMTHLKSSSGKKMSTKITKKQFNLFIKTASSLKEKNYNFLTSVSNSGGILNFENLFSDIERPGLSLYGSHYQHKPNTSRLKNVTTLVSKIISIKEIKKGETVGYDGLWQAKKNTSIGIIPIGYSDGIPLNYGNKGVVLVNKTKARVIGRVAMDLMAIELPNKKIQVGEDIILWGKDLKVDELAIMTDNIPYSFMTSLSERVTRKYIN